MVGERGTETKLEKKQAMSTTTHSAEFFEKITTFSFDPRERPWGGEGKGEEEEEGVGGGRGERRKDWKARAC